MTAPQTPASKSGEVAGNGSHDRLVRPLAFVNLFPLATKAARQCGYALTIHGSLERDCDFVAVPWTDEATTADELYEAIMKALGGFRFKKVSKKYWIEKPHGRLAQNIHLGCGLYIDLSVMPRRPNDQAHKSQPNGN